MGDMTASRRSSIDGTKDNRRVTIADIAREAGVSTSAVSYALNGRPGVGDARRQQIQALVASMGWRPNSAARSLQAARAHAVGLIFRRSQDSFGESQNFLLRFLDGAGHELWAHDVVLVLHGVSDLDAEMAVYRRWWTERRVDGVMVVNPVVDDPRLPLLMRLPLPAVVVGDTRPDSALPAVWTDDSEAAVLAVEHLVSLGHRRIARIARIPDALHTRIRKDAFTAAVTRAGLTADLSIDIDSDSDDEQPTRELFRLLALGRPPTAIIYEDDTLALRAALALREMGLRIPTDLSVMTWDDSLLCRLADPPITALRRDAFGYGQQVSRHLLASLNGQQVGDLRGTVTEIVVRGSTAPPSDAATSSRTRVREARTPRRDSVRRQQ